MRDFFYTRLTLIIEQTQHSQFFLSCTGQEWQAYIDNGFSDLFFVNLIKFDWWHFVFAHITMLQLLAIGTDFTLCLGALVLILRFSLWYPTQPKSVLLYLSAVYSKRWVSFIFLLICAHLVCIILYVPDAGGRPDLTSDIYHVNFYSQLVKIILLLLWLGLQRFLDTLLISNSQGVADFSILGYLVLCFSVIMVSAGDLALFFICLEGFSLILYIMATIGRLHGGITAASKYFAFGTAGSVLILWGVIHFYEMFSSLSFQVLFYMLEYINEFSGYLAIDILNKVEWAAALVLVGLLLKLGVAPIHQWVPDVYAGAPLFVTAFFAIIVKFVLFIVFLRLAYFLNVSGEIEYAAIISLIVGCFSTLRQVEIKRFLAYGSITHMGFLLVGDISSSLVYMASYIVASFVFFSVLLNLRLNSKEFIYLSDLRYIATAGSQWNRTLLVLALASMAGLPPFAGFYGKIIIWSSLLEDIYLFNDFLSYFILLTSFTVSLIIIFYYMRLIIIVYLGNEVTSTIISTTYLHALWALNFKPNYQTHWYRDLNSTTDYLTGRDDAISLRLLDIYFIQGVCALLLVFWTFIMPFIVTLSGFIVLV